MKFLLDAGLPPWMAEAFADAGYDAIHADDIGIGTASDFNVAERARRDGYCIVTRDFDFSDIRAFPPARFHGIVVLTIPRHRGSPYMRLLLEQLFTYLNSGGAIDRKLLIVDPAHIRTRN